MDMTFLKELSGHRVLSRLCWSVRPRHSLSSSFLLLHICNSGGKRGEKSLPGSQKASHERSADIPNRRLQCVAYSFYTVGAAGTSRELNYAFQTAVLVQKEGWERGSRRGKSAAGLSPSLHPFLQDHVFVRDEAGHGDPRPEPRPTQSVQSQALHYRNRERFATIKSASLVSWYRSPHLPCLPLLPVWQPLALPEPPSASWMGGKAAKDVVSLQIILFIFGGKNLLA